MKVTELVAEFARPIVEAQGCELWDVEYVREGSEYFLRLYRDKACGVDIDDCEAVSRAVSLRGLLRRTGTGAQAPFGFPAVLKQPHYREAVPPQKWAEGDSLRAESL